MEIRVVELFAGVGGFRLGLEGYNGKSSTSGYKKKFQSAFKTVWSNQWEPSTKIQHASMVYSERFGPEGHSNVDISKVNLSEIPDHNVLCGGFPCQDYSVAKQLSKSTGIEGKKGVLWWEIHRILENKKPEYVFLENVDRLLKSPTGQRGRDFAIMLASLSDLGYDVEWRVVNASEYGFPQRRKRVFIVGYQKGKRNKLNAIDVIEHDGVLADALPIQSVNPLSALNFEIQGDLTEITKNFNSTKKGAKSPFLNGGFMSERKVTAVETVPDYDGKYVVLGEVLEPSIKVPSEFWIDISTKERWEYLKGSKDEKRKKSNGEIFYYKEGPVTFPDPLDKASRTIITSEGGSTPSRFKIVVNQDGKLRRLMPVELERLNMFPENHTAPAKDARRAFFMGNALVVGVIERIGISIQSHMK